MSSQDSATVASKGAKPPVAKDRPALATISRLLPLIWPAERPDLKKRVVGALLILVVAKLVTVFIPYLYKWATEALVGSHGVGAPSGVAVIVAAPVMLIIAYGVGRIVLNLFNQIRDALFARVSEYAIRKLGYRAFVHMHRLSLRYHLQRRTGGLSRTMDHGMKGVNSIVDHIILNAAPTILEFVLAAVVIGYQFDVIYVIVISITIAVYVWFTIIASNWRIAIRREMNASDTEANAKAVEFAAELRDRQIFRQ